jgi:hypothetical protein
MYKEKPFFSEFLEKKKMENKNVYILSLFMFTMAKIETVKRMDCY